MDDASNEKLRLLASLDLDEVANAVAEIITRLLEPQALAILLWDPDLESFGDKFTFGTRKKEILKLAEEYADGGEAPKEALTELEPDDYKTKLPAEMEPVYCCRLERDSQPVACLLLAGCATDNEGQITANLAQYPFVLALDNSWKFRELERENERLRSQYEDMENKVSILEDRTIKLINDLTIRDSTRTREVQRDRLVYSISNTVRSSVNIQKVLETAVEQIGYTLGASRCLMLRSVDLADQLNVHEFKQPDMTSVKELFHSESGLRFAARALMRPKTHLLDDVEGNEFGYEAEFLRSMQVLSGLLVPLVLRERILGVLFLQNCKERREWSIDDISLIDSLADNLSVAIENAELHQERERQAVTDGLTGVANRRSFNDSFSREFERAKRYEEPLSLVMIDLDFLKKINDTYGHATGDEAIKAIGRVLKQSSRAVDMPARYGGEEFCVLLPNTEIDMAEQLAERLRRFINELEIEGPGQISASIGVGSYPLHADEPDELFQRADEALYAAKQSGRNRVCIAVRADKPVGSASGSAEVNGNGAEGKQSSGTGADTESSRQLT